MTDAISFFCSKADGLVFDLKNINTSIIGTW